MTTTQAALDQLYDAFSGVARPQSLDRCDHCFGAQDEAAILADVPLRSLPDRIVDVFAFECLSGTVGTMQHLRYFLPRVIEVALLDDTSITDLALVSGSFSALARDGWDEQEQAAVRTCLLTFWELSLSRTISCLPEGFLEALAAVDVIDDAVSGWLSRLDEPAAALEFQAFLEGDVELRHSRWQLGNGAQPVGGWELDDWLTSVPLKSRVIELFQQSPDQVVREALRQAIAILMQHPCWFD